MKIFKLTLPQLLLLDLAAYVNLCLMFPHGAKTLEEVPALTLPENYTLVLFPPRDILLLSKSPPSMMCFDKKAAKWVQIDEELKTIRGKP